METVKEKLAKLINEAKEYHISECVKMLTCAECSYKGTNCKALHVAEYLIQNGVTIATDTNDKWVSVDERLPEESLNSVIGWDEYRERCVFVQYYKGEWVLGDHESVKITHWMPLPALPKGGSDES